MADQEMGKARVARLRALMQEYGYDAVVLRHNPDLRWLTGAERTFDDEVAHTAFVTREGQWLHTDSRYFGTFQDRLGKDTDWQLDMDAVSHPAWTASLIKKTHARVVAIEDTADLAFFDALEAELGRQSAACLLPRMHGTVSALRVVKDAEEVSLMRHAQIITDAAFEHICGYIKPGLTELQIRAELESAMFDRGADALSFDTIIASGPNGANPHAQPGERRVEEGDLIVMDYGAGYHDYHSDMTRTVCVGKATDEQKKVYAVVRKANETCEAAIHAGVIGVDIHNLAVKVISDAGYGDYFKHGLGHGVGLQIHEAPYFSRSGAPAEHGVIPAGSVITVEPGIYLPGRFGIRLEDFGQVTEDGYDVFTASAHDLVEIPC